jgi:hypothetical protein
MRHALFLGVFAYLFVNLPGFHPFYLLFLVIMFIFAAYKLAKIKMD